MERLLILDSNSLLNRAFYAIPPLTNSEGIHTNAVYGFTNMLFKMKEEIEKNKERDCIFLDIPLLYESHLEYLCDEIIVVYLDEQRQVQRLMARDHIDESYAYTIINNQISSLKKREMADIVFDNNQGIEELYKQIGEFIERISHEEIINE